jgi:hypothetical protein
MPYKLPTTWPQRPDGFYSDWTTFCIEALGTSLRNEQEGDWLPVVLLAGGGALGAAGMMQLVEANSDIVDRKGKEWGVNDLSAIAKGGSFLLGAALGGAGGMLLMRILNRHTDKESVDAYGHRLGLARREYEELLQDLTAGILAKEHHKAAVEYLFWRLQRGNE